MNNNRTLFLSVFDDKSFLIMHCVSWVNGRPMLFGDEDKYTYRMGNISEFMKTLKQRFSRWYNKLHGRKETLWEERYSATAVSAGSAARMVAAYIDLHPLRPSMVEDPKDYRWSSYAEAVAGDAAAMAGYARLYQGSDRPGAEVKTFLEA